MNRFMRSHESIRKTIKHAPTLQLQFKYHHTVKQSICSPTSFHPFHFHFSSTKSLTPCKVAARHSSSTLSLQTRTRMDGAGAGAEMSFMKTMTKSYLKALVSLHTCYLLLLTYSFPEVPSAWSKYWIVTRISILRRLFLWALFADMETSSQETAN